MDRIIEKKRWTVKKILTIVFTAAFGFLIIYLLFFRDKQSRLYVNKEQLSVAEVRLDRFREFIPTDGVVYPKTTIYIDAVQGGTVESVFVEDGANLIKGDTILKLVNADMELRYMDQETRMYDAINNLQNSKVNLGGSKFTRQLEIVGLLSEIDRVKIDFERKQQLYGESYISDKEFEEKVKHIIDHKESIIYEHYSNRDKKCFLRTLSPVIDPKTEDVVAVTVVSKDISKIKHAEETLKENYLQKQEMYLSTHPYSNSGILVGPKRKKNWKDIY